jgi:hypothetical protein
MTRSFSRGARLPGIAVCSLTAVALLAAAPAARAVPDFAEAPKFGAGHTICVGWADADRDGLPDLAVGNTFNEQNFLYINEGGGAFAERTAFGQRNTFAIAWGDFDNDGDQDVVTGNGSNQANRLIENIGGGDFSGVGPLGNDITVALAWADYDLDGDLDLAVGNGILGNPEPNRLWRNDGGGVFTVFDEFGEGQSDCVIWGDFDGDGDPDLAVGNGGFGSEEPNRLYVNQGDGTFVGRDEFGGGDTSCLVAGDADGDGDLDVAVANWNGGQNRLYENLGAGTFTGHDRFGARDPNTMAWGDFDNDGDLDLAVGNGDFGSADQNYLYVNEGGLVFTESAQFGLGSTDGIAWADHDLDGDLDLAVGNEHTPETNYVYTNGEDDADWLFVRTVGRFGELGAGYSNADGIGAKVAVYDAGFLGDPAHLVGLREIESHGGFASQNMIDAHFGVPGRATVDVRVTWPGSAGSNFVQDLAGVPVPGRITVPEGAGPPVAAPEPAVRTGSVWRVAPNPSRGTVSLVRTHAAAIAGDLLVVDPAGRLVRRLPARALGDDVGARWDGRDARGRTVASGVYFVRLPGEGEAARVVRTR